MISGSANGHGCTHGIYSTVAAAREGQRNYEAQRDRMIAEARAQRDGARDVEVIALSRADAIGGRAARVPHAGHDAQSVLRLPVRAARAHLLDDHRIHVIQAFLVCLLLGIEICIACP